MTVCGLTTALFANITIWQQVILFVRLLFRFPLASFFRQF